MSGKSPNALKQTGVTEEMRIGNNEENASWYVQYFAQAYCSTLV